MRKILFSSIFVVMAIYFAAYGSSGNKDKSTDDKRLCSRKVLF